MSRLKALILLLISLTGGAAVIWKLLAARRVWIGLRDAAPRIATIDYYGLGHVTAQQVQSRLSLKEGDRAPFNLEAPDLLMRITRRLAGVDSRDSVESRLRQIPGVLGASVVAVQEGGSGKAALFVGIAETNTVHTRPQPTGGAALPGSVAGLYEQHAEAFASAVANPAPDFDEDDSQGYAIFTDPKMKMLEERAIAFDRTEENVNAVRLVLHTSANTSQRRSAAWLLSYAPDKKTIVDDLIEATHDPDPEIRNVVTRALILDRGIRQPEPGPGHPDRT